MNKSEHGCAKHDWGAVAANDDRYMAVLVVLSRHGVTTRMREDRVAALVNELLDAAGTQPAPHPTGPRPVPDPPDTAPSRDRRARRKNPTADSRICSQCGWTKPLDAYYWSVKRGRKSATPSAACKACVSARARERRLSSAKLDALNAARLEFTADDDEAGLRCIDCGKAIVAGEQVVAEAGLHHSACVEVSSHRGREDDR